MMPIAMMTGIVFYPFFSRFAFVTPYLIFSMLLLTYLNLSFRNIRFTRMHLWLIFIQITGSILIYLILVPFQPVVVQGAMICVLAPTATSAPVITRMLKGNVESLTAYSLLCNITVALIAPVFFSLVEKDNQSAFFESFLIIMRQVFFLLLVPFIAAILLRKVFRNTFSKAKLFSNISFYLWSFALIIVTSKIVSFILVQDSQNYLTEVLLAVCSLFICILQFLTGRKIGRRYKDTIAGGQGLGQKNTVLAIWMAQTYLNPVSSLGPGMYVLWQNIVNSFQVWRKRKNLD